ncbi:hypothetical protein LIER_43121 [Lithospermum erythrorhizon]|uniref:CCHC-type domain-containing protein n=1 Tax=Lithospermum erythrorhizon TaxID=34254 RepID=A0AAV3PI03_LITER
MMIALEASGKLGFLTREVQPPVQTEKTYNQWRKVNSMLILWILNSLSVEIGRGFVYANSAKELWEEIRQQYEGSNGPRRRGENNDFPNGIDDDYEQIINQILLMELLLVLARTYGMVTNIDKYKSVSVMMIDNVDNRVMNVKTVGDQRFQRGGHSTGKGDFRRSYENGRVNKSLLVCDHCGRRGHVKSGCFKIIGYPEVWGRRNQGSNFRK